MSLAHFRQRLCWQGKITTGLTNISRQIGQISCFSRLSIVPRFMVCDCSRDRLATNAKRNAPKFYISLSQQLCSVTPPPTVERCRLFLAHTHVYACMLAWPYMKSHSCQTKHSIQPIPHLRTPGAVSHFKNMSP